MKFIALVVVFVVAPLAVAQRASTWSRTQHHAVVCPCAPMPVKILVYPVTVVPPPATRPVAVNLKNPKRP